MSGVWQAPPVGGTKATYRRDVAFVESPLPVVLLDGDGRIVDANAATARLLGEAADRLVGTSWLDRIVAHDQPAIRAQLASRKAGRRHGTQLVRLHVAGGRTPWVRLSWFAHGRTSPGTAAPDEWVSVHVEDVTAAAEHLIGRDDVLANVESERSALQAALDANPDGMAILQRRRTAAGDPTEDLVLVRMNAAGAAAGGRSPAELAGQPLEAYFPQARRTGLLGAVLETLGTGVPTRLLVETDSTGGWEGAFENTVVPVGPDRVLVTFRDVTQGRIEEQRLLHAATHDALTGLPNRALLRDRIEHALHRAHRRGGTIAIAFMDLDGFKAVNDTLGHPAGDEVLREVATRLAGAVREGDTLARLGGDEFVLVLEDCPDEAAWLTVYTRVVDALVVPVVVHGESVSLRASIGVLFTRDGDPDAHLRDADIAMYAAKQSGRSRYTVFTEGHRRSAVDQHLLDADLSAALEAGQFEVFYQPIVDVRSDAVAGAEALLRWRHPQRGLVSPAVFLPSAEAGGLMVAIGEWVVRQAVAHVARWRADERERGRGLEPVVAVNVSAQQLVRSDFAATVASALADSDVGGDALVVELTESQMLPSSASVLNQLARLRETGVQVAIDDFGTGYSSLAHLTELPVDLVKIDRTFIEGLADARREAVLRSTVSMVAALGARCVVEGVETAEQLDLVGAIGADLVQGFLLGRPAPAA